MYVKMFSSVLNSVLCEPDRTAYLPLDGEQVGHGSVWSQEKTGLCLQTLPQVLYMSETYLKKIILCHLFIK